MNWPVRTIFWGFLLLDFLSASPVRDFFSNYEVFKENIKCLPDSTFYTATDVQPECMAAALNCTFLEFTNVVKYECEDSSGIMIRVPGVLELMLKQLKKDDAQNSANDCACEKWSQRPFSDFLANVKVLFEQLTSQ